MNILGISCYYHDAAAALLMGGELVAAAEEERFTRKKHDSSFPENAIKFCLKYGQLKAEDLDYVVFYEKPLIKFERILQTTLSSFPRSYGVFRESMVTWFDEKLWIKSKLQNGIGVPPQKILFVEHHLTHAASAMFCSPYAEAAVVTIDGVGEWTTASLGQATAKWNGSGENRIELSRELRFPVMSSIWTSSRVMALQICPFGTKSASRRNAGLCWLSCPHHYQRPGSQR